MLMASAMNWRKATILVSSSILGNCLLNNITKELLPNYSQSARVRYNSTELNLHRNVGFIALLLNPTYNNSVFMALIIQKFGGTSVGNLDRLQHVAKKVAQTRAQGHDVVVVVSAMNGETDRLLNLAKAIQIDPDPREYAVLLTTGEQVSTALLTMALMTLGCPARSYTGAQARIQTDNHHEKANILNVDCQALRAELAAGCVPVVAGFQGISAGGEITTLGRGGSDTTAVALAAALKADECQIYTDVDGIYTADPKLVPKAQRLDRVTFSEMLELAGSGAKVLQQRAVEFAQKNRVPLRVLSSFQDGPGTLVTFEAGSKEPSPVTGIAASQREAKLTIKGLGADSESMTQLLTALNAIHVDIDLFNQQANSAAQDVNFTLLRDDYARAHTTLRKFAEKFNASALIEDMQVAKLSLVGVGLRSHPAIIDKLFKTLGTVGIGIQLVSASELKVSIVINEKEIGHGACALHTAFGLDSATP